MPDLKNSALLQVPLHVWRHPANRNTRLRALLKATLFQLRGRVLHRPSYAKVGVNGRMLCPLHSNGSSAMLYANPPDFDEMNFWRGFLRAGDLFLDVGSNVGSYAIWAGDCGAEVWAFEPDPQAFQLLCANIRLNDYQIVPHQLALGAEAGQLRLTTGLDTTNRLIFDQAAMNMSSTQEVEVTPLDSVVAGRRIRGVKIDVEGAERLVIEGAGETLAGHRIGVLQVEWNSMCESTLGESRDPLLHRLQQYGYIAFRPSTLGPHRLEPSEQVGYGKDLFFAAPEIALSLSLDP